MRSKRVTCDGVDASEVEKIEADLLVLTSAKTINSSLVQNVLKGLEALESSIREVEEELDCVCRRLMKTRVSLLNILNHLLSRSHPRTVSIEEQLNRLRASDATTPSISGILG
ncbi:hypothetical protein HS088_TW11G01013 [Tripterygium wilfordii]|uniref:Uncharacterized protein n=1 Tax=Tripterygium wilfordii TaxID=458696 RepID=A0A7J7D3M8_TRIWF|nr:hypothetical protein HS088_TW11G01013 [Tripterygium wilfordii]